MNADHTLPSGSVTETVVVDLCDETTRAAVLAAYGLDALEDDPELAAMVTFAARLCNTPIALVSVVETERQRFLAREGLAERETPRSMSFCAHAMLEPETMQVEDATHDPRFADNALVTGAPNIRFYAGAPLIAPDGVPIGSLCVISPEPRPGGLTDLQQTGLEVLAQAVMRRLKGHRANLEARQALERSEDRFRMLAESMPQISWSANEAGVFDYYNLRWQEFTGAAGPKSADDWEPLIHPEDWKQTIADWKASAQLAAPFQGEYRLRRVDGEWRWVLSRAVPITETNGSIRWFGTVTDIHDAHELSDQRDLLARELSHRIKNVFAVIGGLVTMSARTHPEAAAYAAVLGARIAALGRAHEFIRPGGNSSGEHLRSLLEELFAAYVEKGSPRIVVSGDDCAIGDRSMTPLALVFHELATNAVKYGALSRPGGRIAVECRNDDDAMIVVWRETGGPAPTVPEMGATGFGSRLLRMSIEHQLSGSMTLQWPPEGLIATIRIPHASL